MYKTALNALSRRCYDRFSLFVVQEDFILQCRVADQKVSGMLLQKQSQSRQSEDVWQSLSFDAVANTYNYNVLASVPFQLFITEFGMNACIMCTFRHASEVSSVTMGFDEVCGQEKNITLFSHLPYSPVLPLATFSSLKIKIMKGT